MHLTEVNNPQLAADFIKANIVINKGNANYIRPLDKDINEVFDEKLNKAFRFGKCTRWILKDENGNLAGRIAAFVNKKYYILTYFQQPQYFDSEGRLLVGRRRRHIRKINGDVYHRINDRVCYTISDRFR